MKFPENSCFSEGSRRKMKLVKWLDKNLELLILAIMLAVMCCLSFANVIIMR